MINIKNIFSTLEKKFSQVGKKKSKENIEEIFRQMITFTFRLVATALYNIAQMFGMTYNEVNVLAYYLLIPLSWTIMLDMYIGLPLTTGALLYIWIGIKIGTWKNKNPAQNIEYEMDTIVDNEELN